MDQRLVLLAVCEKCASLACSSLMGLLRMLSAASTVREHPGCRVSWIKPGRYFGCAIRETLSQVELILITSQEIDELGEADNMAQARLQIDGVLSHLRRGVRVLADHELCSTVLKTGVEGQKGIVN
jgi:hypothetical protein